jgi:UTP--glucose-1-phosphate uridylyltransferase
MEVRKAVIAAAGWGTRFLPITRAYPKELLPLVNKPIIQYAVEEALDSGIKEVIIVVSEGSHAVRDYFKPNLELRTVLERRGDKRGAEELGRLDNLPGISYVVQSARKGLGHAVLMAKQAVGNEPFAVILPDDVIDAREPALAQMLKTFRAQQASVVAVDAIDSPEIQRYGVITPEAVGERVYRVLSLVEKPAPELAPSHLGIVGRYILTPEIFDAIEATPAGWDGEIQLTDSLSLLLEKQPIFALEFEGRRFDVGRPPGWVEAQVAFGIKNPEYGDGLREKLRRMV